MVDSGGLELVSHTYTKIGVSHQNKYARIIIRHQLVWQNGNIRVQ